MEDPLDQRSVIKGIPTPQSMEASVEIKQEPELDMELLLQASPWDFNIKDPLKNEIEIGETRVTTQDPFSMIQQTAIKSEPKAEENEGTEDYSHHNDSNTDMNILCDDINSGGNVNVTNSPHLFEYSSNEILSGSNVESWTSYKVKNNIQIVHSASNIARYTGAVARSTSPPPLVYFSDHVELPQKCMATIVLPSNPSPSPVQRSKDLRADISDATSDTSTTKEITPVNSKKELDKLEEFLKTDNNMQSMAERLNRLMSEQDVVNRLSEALYIVVNDKFLTQCSWLGSKREERKIGLKQYVNLQNLIQLVAENGVHKLESDEFKIFLKLKIFHAKERLRSKNMRKNVCRFKKFDIKSNEETNSLDPFFDAVSITEIIPVTSKEELARLERFLNTESNMQSMVERVSSSLTSDDVVNRMNDAFHQILKVEFVTKVSWYGVSNRWGKIALRRYVNFLSLLQCVVEDGVHSLTKVEFERILKSTIHSAKRNLHSANLKNSVCKFTNGHSNSTSIQETNSSDPVMETESAATITPVNSKEELDKLEEFLNTDNNMQSMAERLNRLMSGQDVVNRLSEALYIVVNDEFLVQCSWLGSKRKERKIGLKQYVNLQNLLHCVAEAGVFRLEKDEFERILKSKIFHAKERLSQSVCGLKKFCTKSDEETHSLDPFFDAVTFTEIIPVTSKKELDRLERFLNTKSNMQSMVEHISSSLTMNDIVSRLKDALRMVVEVEFLTQFSWIEGGNIRGKIGLRRYRKFQNLLHCVVEDDVRSVKRADFERILKSTIHITECELRFKNVRKRNFSGRVIDTESGEKISPIVSKEELDKLEEFLNADNNMQSMVRRLSSLLTADDAKNRLSEALYIVVSNKLLSKCRWLGTGKDGLKIPFKRYMNLQKLLRLAADGGVHNMEKRNFETILKLKIFHAKRRLLNFKNMRKSVCRFRQRKTNSASVHKTPPIDSVTHTGKDTKISLETRCTTEIFPSRTKGNSVIIPQTKSIGPAIDFGSTSKVSSETTSTSEILPALIRTNSDIIPQTQTIDPAMYTESTSKVSPEFIGSTKEILPSVTITNSANVLQTQSIDPVMYTGSTWTTSPETRSVEEVLQILAKRNCTIIPQIQSIGPIMHADSASKVPSPKRCTAEILPSLTITSGANILQTHSIGSVLYGGSTWEISPEPRSFMEIPLETRASKQISLEARASSTKISPGAGSNSIISDIKSKEELDKLEEYLNTENNMQSMAKRLNRLMSAQDVENRFNEALNLVVGVGFLTKCSWVGSRLTIGLQKYVNFQSLLRLLAEDSVHTLRKADLEKFFKMNINHAKGRKRTKQQK